MTMDIVVPRKNLLRLVKPCRSVARAGKRRMPLLDHVLLEATSTSLRVSAHALQWWISSSTWADGQAGSVAVPCEMLFAALQQIPDGPVRLTVEEHTDWLTVATIATPRSITICGVDKLPAEMPMPPSAESWRVPIGALSTLLTWTRRAISTDETRPHVNALFLDGTGGKLRAWATDGHRAHMAEVVPAVTGSFPAMLLPRGAVLKLRALVEAHRQSEVNVLVASDGKHAWFSIAGVTLGTRLVEAQFPPCNVVVPQKRDLFAVVPRWAFLQAMESIAALGVVNGGQARVGIKLTKNTLSLEARIDSDEWSFRDEIPVDYSGPEVKRYVSSTYLLDALEALPASGDMVLEVRPMEEGDRVPICLRPPDGEVEEDLLAVIMPVVP